MDKDRDEEDREEVVVEVALRTMAMMDKMEDKAGDEADRLIEHQEFTDRLATV